MNAHQQNKLEKLLDSRPIIPEMVDDFFRSVRHNWRIQDRLEAYEALQEYTDRIEAEQPNVADSLRGGYKLSFETKARTGAKESLRQIVKIPPDTKIDPAYLRELNNDDFVAAFDTFQEFLIACYSDIARAPFEWGYPSSHKKLKSVDSPDRYGDRRLRNILSNLFSCGEFDGYNLTVNKKKFFKNVYLSSYRETTLMLEGLANMGLISENVESKSKSFSVYFPDNPNMLIIVPLFSSSGECRRCYENCSHMGKCYWNYPLTRNTSFSYRFFEDKTTQTHEAEFLIAMDSLPENLREIHFWLYEEAKKIGYDFNPFDATSNGCILYRKGWWGGKNLPLVGAYDISGSRLEGNKFAAITKYKRLFKAYPTEIAKLMEKFPDAIGNRAYDCPLYCNMEAENICKKAHLYKIDGVNYHSCGHKSFLFMEPTFDDIKLIVELWKLENRIME